MYNLEDDVKKEFEKKNEVKVSEKIDFYLIEKENFFYEIKKESKSKESENLVDNGFLEEKKNLEGESKKLDKVGREDFDFVGVMDWKDGVGELEGSNLKVRVLLFLKWLGVYSVIVLFLSYFVIINFLIIISIIVEYI